MLTAASAVAEVAAETTKLRRAWLGLGLEVGLGLGSELGLGLGLGLGCATKRLLIGCTLSGIRPKTGLERQETDVNAWGRRARRSSEEA